MYREKGCEIIDHTIPFFERKINDLRLEMKRNDRSLNFLADDFFCLIATIMEARYRIRSRIKRVYFLRNYPNYIPSNHMEMAKKYLRIDPRDSQEGFYPIVIVHNTKYCFIKNISDIFTTISNGKFNPMIVNIPKLTPKQVLKGLENFVRYFKIPRRTELFEKISECEDMNKAVLELKLNSKPGKKYLSAGSHVDISNLPHAYAKIMYNKRELIRKEPLQKGA